MSDTLTEASTVAPPPVTPTPARSSTGRWWVAVAIGCLLALPFGILLSYVAFLLAYLGLFFYALFGLIIGACMFRIGASARPIPFASVLVGTTLTILVGWGISIVWEIRDLPRDISKIVVENAPRLPEGTTKAEYRVATEERVRTYLRERYPPGGSLGYLRWAFESGMFEAGTFEGYKRPIARPQRRWIWAIRLLASIALFSFGVSALVWPLRRPSHVDESSAGQTLYGL